MKTANLRRSWTITGWMMAGLIIYLSLLPIPPTGPAVPGIDKLIHFGAYLALTLWFAQLYSGRPVFLFFVAGFLAMGATLELLQGLIPERYPEWLDLLANGGGVFLGGFLGKTRLGTLFARNLKN